MEGRGTTKFRMGDVVKIGGWFGSTDNPDELRSGIIIEVNSKSKKKWDYKVYWFTGDIYSLYEGELERCIGFESGECRGCIEEDLCSHLQEIMHCEFSEFGQWRNKGKTIGMPVDTEACIKCLHRSLCWGQRFIQV